MKILAKSSAQLSHLRAVQPNDGGAEPMENWFNNE
jgi:hypothetical protein